MSSEKDAPKNKFILGLVVVVVISLVVVVFVISQYFTMSVREETERKVANHQSSRLTELQNQEKDLLTHLQYVKGKPGVVSMPLDLAITLVKKAYATREPALQDWTDTAAAVAPAASSAATSAPAGTPATSAAPAEAPSSSAASSAAPAGAPASSVAPAGGNHT